MPSPVRLDFTPLRRARETRGWSQATLAKSAGMHPATLNRIEKNITEAPLTKVFALSRALGLPAETLYLVVE